MSDLLDFSGGTALAATQVGWDTRVFIQKAPGYSDSTRVFINPFYRGLGQRVLKTEGCLSFPGIFKSILRFPSIDAWYMDVDGRSYRESLHGFNAHVFQHETDHLFGTLYIDYMNKEDRQDVEDQILWNDKRLRYISLMAQ
jgi:peptide deformylase